MGVPAEVRLYLERLVEALRGALGDALSGVYGVGSLARKLELVVISAAVARAPGGAPRWELNLNSGAHEREHVGLDPAVEPSHWFVVDLAIAYERGVSLLGPPARSLVGPPDSVVLAGALSDAVAWFARHGAGAETVAAACRAWYWRQTGTFTAKRKAVRWAAAQLGDQPARPSSS